MQKENDQKRGNLELGMDDMTAFDKLSHQRWLMDNGALNDMHKDQLYLYGSIVNQDVRAVELSIDVDNKNVNYVLSCTPKLLKKHRDYIALRHDDSLLGLWKFKRMHKKEGNLNFPVIIQYFIKQYCGDKWTASVTLSDIKQYKDDFKELENEYRDEEHKGTNKLPDPG